MKRCSKCGLEKPLDEFHNKAKGYCKLCRKEYIKTHYKNNPEYYKNKAKAEKELAKALVHKTKDVPCKDCGIKYPYYVMQFDHLGDKKFTIARNYHAGINKLKKEIEKCEVVCANCHAIRTYMRSSGRPD